MSESENTRLRNDAHLWEVHQDFQTAFAWDYDTGRQKMLNLYEKGKKLQWNASDRIDWSQELDEENPEGLPDEIIPIYGSPVWERLTPDEQAHVRRHFQAWQVSQFMHGEQGALVCTSKIVQQVPNMDAKFYGATQVVDEARHVEAFSRLLHEKFDISYPITAPLKALLDDILRDSRWDMTYLGMQVMIEGTALAAFGLIRDQAKNPLASAVNAYVLQDEARHVAFGRQALRDYYPELSDKERDEREEFAVEASYLLRDRIRATDLWEALDLPVAECEEFTANSELLRGFRTLLFTRVVPIMKEIGLWGPRIQKAYTEMGVIAFQDGDIEELSRSDEEIADEFDRRHGEIVTVAALAE